MNKYVLLEKVINSENYGYYFVITKPTTLKKINEMIELRPIKEPNNYIYQILRLKDALKLNKLIGKEYLKRFNSKVKYNLVKE